MLYSPEESARFGQVTKCTFCTTPKVFNVKTLQTGAPSDVVKTFEIDNLELFRRGVNAVNLMGRMELVKVVLCRRKGGKLRKMGTKPTSVSNGVSLIS